MFNIENGDVFFDDGLILHRFESLDSISKKTDLRQSDIWSELFTVGIKEFSGLRFNITILIESEILKKVYIYCKDVDGIDNEKWDMENEIIRKRFHDRFLQKCFRSVEKEYPLNEDVVFCFPGGEVYSSLDAKGVDASIAVSYTE